MPSLNKAEFRNNYYVTDMIPGKDLDLVKMPAGIATINIKYIHQIYTSDVWKPENLAGKYI